MDHQLNLDRLSAAIGDNIMAFLRKRIADGRREFHADDLRRAVVSLHPRAPGSADRILRALRQANRCDYRVINRRLSLYEVGWVEIVSEAA